MWIRVRCLMVADRHSAGYTRDFSSPTMSPSNPQPSTSDATRLGTGSGLVLLGLGAGRGVKLLTRVLIGRLLGAAALGLYDLAWTFILILSHVARGGLQVAVVRFGAPLWSQGRHAALWRLVRRGLLVPLVLGGGVAAALFFAAPWLAGTVFRKPELASAIRTVSPLVPVASGLAVLAGATQATQRMRYTVLTRDVTQPVVQILLFLLLWWLGYGLAAAFWGALVGGVVAFVLALALVFKLTRLRGQVSATPQADGEATVRQLVLFSLPVAVSGMLAAYLLWVDRLLVGYFRPAAELGIYAAAAQFGILFALLLHGFTTMFTPMFSDLLDRGERERMRELFRVSTKWGLYLLLPLMIVLAIRPEVALGGLFGAEFALGARALQILLIGQFVNVLSGQVGMVLILSGRQRSWMALTAIALALNIALDLLWIPRFGLEGAAAASTLALALLFGTGLHLARSRLGIFPFDRRSWKLVPPAALAALAVSSLGRLGLVPSFPGLLLVLTSSYFVAVATRLLLPSDREDRELLAVLRGRSPKEL